MTIQLETPVREIVLAMPSAIPLFEQHGIDYCCGGSHSLADACQSKGLSTPAILDQLAQLAQTQPPSPDAWLAAPLPEVVRYIVDHHHAFARRQLEVILPLAEKVSTRHGELHPEVRQLAEHLHLLAAELAHHFTCEESILFPAILRLDAGHHPLFPPVFGNIAQPIARMLRDHEQTGEELRALRSISNDLKPPAEACTSWRALYQAIVDLESDLHRHIHLENNILFPRAQQQAQVAL